MCPRCKKFLMEGQTKKLIYILAEQNNSRGMHIWLCSSAEKIKNFGLLLYPAWQAVVMIGIELVRDGLSLLVCDGHVFSFRCANDWGTSIVVCARDLPDEPMIYALIFFSAFRRRGTSRLMLRCGRNSFASGAYGCVRQPKKQKIFGDSILSHCRTIWTKRMNGYEMFSEKPLDKLLLLWYNRRVENHRKARIWTRTNLTDRNKATVAPHKRVTISTKDYDVLPASREGNFFASIRLEIELIGGCCTLF